MQWFAVELRDAEYFSKIAIQTTMQWFAVELRGMPWSFSRPYGGLSRPIGVFHGHMDFSQSFGPMTADHFFQGHMALQDSNGLRPNRNGLRSNLIAMASDLIGNGLRPNRNGVRSNLIAMASDLPDRSNGSKFTPKPDLVFFSVFSLARLVI